MFFDSQGFYGGIQKGITEGSKGAGAELILSNSKLDAAAEAAFIDSAIASGVDGLIVSPVSETASVVALERAHEAGIPIICYNTCLGADDTKRLVAGFVTTDQYDFGHQLGKSAAAYVKATRSTSSSAFSTAMSPRPVNSVRRASSPLYRKALAAL